MSMRVLAVLLGVLLWTGAAAGQTVRVDLRAWQEISAAWERLNRVKTYRMRITSPGQPAPSVVEPVNPDRSRMVVKQEKLTIESINVGKETRFRMAGPGMPGTWQCQGDLPKGTRTQRLYIGRDGLPRRLEILGGKGGQPATTIDYYDFNAPITIPLPACS